MKKFEKYITETKNTQNNSVVVDGKTYTIKELLMFDEFWQDIKKNCQPFLKELGNNKWGEFLMWRGVKSGAPDFFTNKPRSDRKPSDTDQRVHKVLDDTFNKKFGWRARSNSLFCTGNPDIAQEYSDHLYMIFPDKKYDYLWSPVISDLYAYCSFHIEDYIKADKEKIKSLEAEYKKDYGEGNGSGSWFYKKVNYHGSYDTRGSKTKTIIDDIGGDSKHIEKNLVWKPLMTFDSYVEFKTQFLKINVVSYNMALSAAEGIVDVGVYKKNQGLVDALARPVGNEIMIKCNKYHAIKEKYEDLVRLAFFKPNRYNGLISDTQP